MVERYAGSYSLPRQVGDYEIRRLLGSGATGVVYEGRHAALGRRAAIKLLHPHLIQSELAKRRFLREGRAVSRIAHPNVVDVFGVGEHAGVPYLVMSLVEGEDLRTHLTRHGFMSPTEVADCLLPVVDGVAAAHEAGIIHRDLKPSNIRLARGPGGALVPKVLDFGISKLADEEHTELTDSDVALGTTNYMAPEQLRSAKDVDVRCDIYALGVLLYECLTGTRPFHGATTYDLMHAILTAPIRSPSRIRSNIPAELDDVVLRAMDRDKAARYASARELSRALAPFASASTARVVGSADYSMTDLDRAGSFESVSRLTVTVLSTSERKPILAPRAKGWILAACAAGAASTLFIESSRPRWSPSSAPSGYAVATAATAMSDAQSAAPAVVLDRLPAENALRLPIASAERAGRPPPVAGVAARPLVRSRPRAAAPASPVAPVASQSVRLGTNGAPILE